MVKISKETKVPAEKIVSMASEFFGRNGLGLEEKSRNSCCITLEGGGGYVSVRIDAAKDKGNVTVESREWDYQAREFLRQL